MRRKDRNKMDESTFNIWKNELEKELPSFWEDMNNNSRFR